MFKLDDRHVTLICQQFSFLTVRRPDATATFRAPRASDHSTGFNDMSQRQILPVSEAEFPYFYGVDVGGTNIKIGLLDNRGRTLAFRSIPTEEAAGPGPAIERAAATCRDLAREIGARPQDIPQAGLGAPGPMCLRRGLLLNPVNLPHWHNFKIQDALSKALEIPVSFVNDANAAAFGEYWIGTGEDFESLALFTLGTGVGGGLIVKGRLINGVNSFGSECGHFIVDSRPDARLCVWGGGRGHLEAYASASAVAARTCEEILAGANTSLSEILDERKSLTSKHVYEAAKRGDGFAMKIINETAFYLGIGVAGAVHAIDPGIVAIGGAMDFGGSQCEIGKQFLEGIKAEFVRRTFPNVAEGTKIEFASLGGFAGYIGAAGIAHQDFHG